LNAACTRERESGGRQLRLRPAVSPARGRPPLLHACRWRETARYSTEYRTEYSTVHSRQMHTAQYVYIRERWFHMCVHVASATHFASATALPTTHSRCGPSRPSWTRTSTMRCGRGGSSHSTVSAALAYTHSCALPLSCFSTLALCAPMKLWAPSTRAQGQARSARHTRQGTQCTQGKARSVKHRRRRGHGRCHRIYTMWHRTAHTVRRQSTAYLLLPLILLLPTERDHLSLLSLLPRLVLGVPSHPSGDRYRR
jgi:hypothetical protein